jgi:ferredoxin-nitrite reductase
MGEVVPFTQAQKEYLEGYAAGLRALNLVPTAGAPPAATDVTAAPTADTAFGLPLDELTREERFKLEENPLDIWDKILRHAAAGKAPDGSDVFRFKFHGLFYLAPTQDSFMVRVRIPGNVASSVQMRALARIAATWGKGYGDVTTRGNVQIREFAPKDTINVLMALADAGLSSQGSGADNIRNITATPTAGLDPDELYDVRPLAKGLQFYIKNNRDLFGLPRKFNVSFDSGGTVSVVADTNDIGFQAVRVAEGKTVAAGVYFRVLLGGITGHGVFARDAGILVQPEECVAVAAAIIRAFNEHGDRTDRKKARMHYAIERIGLEAFLASVEKRLSFPLRRVPEAECQPRRPVLRHGHIGIYKQKQQNLNYVGVVMPVGRMTAKQMEGLADIADECGSGELRPTVWQNVIIPNVPNDKLSLIERRVKALGFDTRASSVAAGLVACTGNTGCKLAQADTKGHALKIRKYLEKEVELDRPINIHLTGCPNSCAQHDIGDIGLMGVRVAVGDQTVDGYNLHVGGGCDNERGLGREIAKSVAFDEVPPILAKLVKNYMGNRIGGESFLEFARRHDVAALQAMAGVRGR